MSQFNSGGPFHPQPDIGEYEGITRRDWLAGMAMQGVLSNASYVDGLNKTCEVGTIKMSELLADVAYDYADAMIAEGDNDAHS